MGGYEKTLYPKEARHTLRQRNKEKQLQAFQMTARYRVHYDLVYDGGMNKFTLYYNHYWHARIDAFIQVYIRSWGGTVTLEDRKQYHNDW